MTKEQLIKDGYKLVDTIGEHDIYGIEGSSVYYAMGRDAQWTITDMNANYKNGVRKTFRYARLWTRPNVGFIAVILHILPG